MGQYFYIEDNKITADVSYLVDHYIIGLHIGKIYTILNNKFESKEDAINYLYENFDWIEPLK